MALLGIKIIKNFLIFQHVWYKLVVGSGSAQDEKSDLDPDRHRYKTLL
jgi:hypothetical protein